MVFHLLFDIAIVLVLAEIAFTATVHKRNNPRDESIIKWGSWVINLGLITLLTMGIFLGKTPLVAAITLIALISGGWICFRYAFEKGLYKLSLAGLLIIPVCQLCTLIFIPS